MKYIVVPPTVALSDPETGNPVEGLPKMSFKSYAYRVWLNDSRGIKASDETTAPEATERWGKVIRLFGSAAEGEVIPLEDADYKTLRKIVEAPALIVGNALIEVQLLSFVQAVLCAKGEPPENYRPLKSVSETHARS